MPISRATQEHVVTMCALGLRQADAEEWVGGVGGDVMPAVLLALGVPGALCETLIVDKVPLCMWGASPRPGQEGWGQAWFVATERAMTRTYYIHQYLAGALGRMHATFHTLAAFTHPRNTLHHRWLERYGFKQQPETYLTVTGIEYLVYHRVRP